MSRRVWTVDTLLRAWGEWYEYGRLATPDLRGVPRGECGKAQVDESHGAYLYVEGMEPPCVQLARAFVVAKPALVHVYAKLRPPETFDVPLFPGQSELTRRITCNVMVNDFKDVLALRVEVCPYLPSLFEAES